MSLAILTMTAMTVARVTLATGVTLEYVERGDPKGTPVVFLHGYTDSWRSFETLLPHLPPSVRAVAISQRGQGGSSRPESGFGTADLAADVAALLDALSIRSAVVVGHSMGGMVAQRFALDYPSRTRGLVLLATFPTLKGHPDVQGMWDSVLRDLRDPVDPGFVRDFQASTVALPLAAGQLDTFVSESLRVPARVWRALAVTQLGEDLSPDLGRIAAPTLVVAGDKDGISRRQERDTLAKAIRGAAVVDYEGFGHAIHWEDPARVAADIARFVRSLPDQAGTLPQR